MNLFIGNISKSVSEDALRALFSEFGEVTSVRIPTDKVTGHAKGFGFVEMRDEKQGAEAMRKLANVEFFGLKLVVSKAHTKTSTY